MDLSQKHIPVMMQEVLSLLKVQPSDTVMDMTVGAGGHFSQMADMLTSPGTMIGVDRDLQCIENIRQKYPDFTYVHGSWTHALSIISTELSSVDKVLIDCGVSSMQLDEPSRGFSFQHDAPLDMRMDQKSSLTAYDLVHQKSEKELADILYLYADERRSRRIAKSIVAFRRKNRLNTTQDLVDAVIDALGPHRGKIHPATKTFQAIRIAVNDELGELEQTISLLLENLQPGARIVIITFHSIEDRIVKYLFRDAYQAKKVIRLTKKPFQATREESKINPRSRSAKVRGVEIL